jgi:hypothetical protein
MYEGMYGSPDSNRTTTVNVFNRKVKWLDRTEYTYAIIFGDMYLISQVSGEEIIYRYSLCLRVGVRQD